jgi:hypothetical protein
VRCAVWYLVDELVGLLIDVSDVFLHVFHLSWCWQSIIIYNWNVSACVWLRRSGKCEPIAS